MTKRKANWWEQPVPTFFPRTYLDYARERGADPAHLLQRAQLPTHLADHPSPELSMLALSHLIDAMIEVLGNDGLGVEIGLHMPPTAFGNLGYGLLCSETLGDAADLLFRYWHLLGRAMDAAFTRGEPDCVVDLVHVAPLPSPLDQLSFESTLASFHRGFQLLINPPARDMEIWFTAAAPPYADKIRQQLGQVRFNMPANQFRFRAHLLEQRLPMHNPQGLAFAMEQCEREEARLNDDGYPFRERVRAEMACSDRGYPNLETVAERLNMTSRTLRRRLEEEGTNFKALQEEAKRRDAITLLDDQQLSIQRVAELLGYQDPANFTRAFRQWTSQTPSQYRDTRQQPNAR